MPQTFFCGSAPIVTVRNIRRALTCAGDGGAQVVGGLLDAEAPDEFINNLILSVRSLIPVEQLCAEVPPMPTSAGFLQA